MLKKLNNKYLIFGGSIIISRGLEYFLLFFAALELSKSDYGELEYYKKIVEVGSSVLAFGFPAMILSYTKSNNSKTYFYLLSMIFVLCFGSFLMFLGIIDKIWFLILPAMIYHALFFTGGIAQSYQIVKMGSNYASIYKIITSFLFYGIIIIIIYFNLATGKSYLYPAYILIPISLLFASLEFYKIKIDLNKVKKYWKLFRKLLSNSFTLVISNFANLMFLYTDIFVIKLLSKNANSEIAEFSFALNVASIILLISTTLIQVDIEKLKKNSIYIKVLNKRIFFLTLGISAFLIMGYYIFIENWYLDYRNTFILFLIILLGKFFSNHANLYGTFLIIHKKFKLNLIANLVFLILNIAFCFLLYRYIGIIGLAISSSSMLILRSLTFLYYSNRRLKDERY